MGRPLSSHMARDLLLKLVVEWRFYQQSKQRVKNPFVPASVTGRSAVAPLTHAGFGRLSSFGYELRVNSHPVQVIPPYFLSFNGKVLIDGEGAYAYLAKTAKSAVVCGNGGEKWEVELHVSPYVPAETPFVTPPRSRVVDGPELLRLLEVGASFVRGGDQIRHVRFDPTRYGWEIREKDDVVGCSHLSDAVAEMRNIHNVWYNHVGGWFSLPYRDVLGLHRNEVPPHHTAVTTASALAARLNRSPHPLDEHDKMRAYANSIAIIAQRALAAGDNGEYNHLEKQYLLVDEMTTPVSNRKRRVFTNADVAIYEASCQTYDPAVLLSKSLNRALRDRLRDRLGSRSASALDAVAVADALIRDWGGWAASETAYTYGGAPCTLYGTDMGNVRLWHQPAIFEGFYGN